MTKTSRFGPTPIPITQRFDSKVEKTDGCWLWKGTVNNNGYGTLYDNATKSKELAHRVAWKIRHGEYPSKYLLHSCDTTNCVNPDHLREGDNTENLLETLQRNEKVKDRLLVTNEDIQEMKKLYSDTLITHRQLAQKYGVSTSSIHNYLHNKSIALVNREEIKSKYSKVKEFGRVETPETPSGFVRTNITLELAEEIRQEYKNGLNQKEICIKHRISKSAVYNILTNRTHVPGESKKKNQFDEIEDSTVLAALEDYSKGGKTQGEIAKKFGFSRTLFINVVTGRVRPHLGGTKIIKTITPSKKRLFTSEQAKEIKARYNSNESVAAIAEDLGVSKHVIYRYIKQ